MKRVLNLVIALSLSLLCAAVSAQAFPSKFVKLLVPYAPGGTTDIMARALQDPMQKALGQPLIIENKAGGAGVIAMREAARAPADGYTLVFINNGLVEITPVLQTNAGYDGIKDFAPVGMVSATTMFVVANENVPANNLKEFIDYARKHPNELEYASAGPGSFGHLSSELFAQAAGIKMEHFDLLPNYWDTVPHNIKKRTERTRSCDVCHVDKEGFLTKETLIPGGSKANEGLIFAPKTIKQ